MKKNLLFIVFLLFFFLSFSQTKEDFCTEWEKQIDTISKRELRLKVCKKYIPKVNDNCRTKIYTKYASIFYISQKNDSSKYYYNKVIHLSQKTNNTQYLTLAYSKLAEIAIEQDSLNTTYDLLKKTKLILAKEPSNESWKHYYAVQTYVAETKANYKLANKYIDSTIAFCKQINKTKIIPSLYHNKGNLYSLEGNYEEAIKNYLKSIALYEAQKLPRYLDRTYYQLALTYINIKQYTFAKKYITKSLKLAKKSGDQFMIAMNYQLLSFSSRKLDDYDYALVASDSALLIANEINSIDIKTKANKEKGWVYYEKYKDYNKAEHYFLKSYESAKASNNKYTKFEILQGLIQSLINNRKYSIAKKYLTILSPIIHDLKNPLLNSNLDKMYSQYYEETGQSTLAIKHLKRYHKITDSISNKDVLTKVADLEKKYETQKKELEIVSLNKEKEEQKAITEKAQLKQNIYLITAIFLLSLLFIGLWLYRKLKLQQQNLTKAHNKLDETNSIKNRLFSIIAHDLRGMLLPFQRSGKIVKYHLDEGNNDRAIVVAQEIEKNSTNLSNMLDNLLDWSLKQMNGYSLNPVNVSLKNELQTIIDGFTEQANFKSIYIDLKQEKDETIFIDKGAFHVIFRNLIGNAIKYTENGNIIITFKKEQDTILFNVNDSGIGMNSEQLDSLFKLKDNKTTIGTQGEKGTGIGLNLVYRFVKLMQGKITVSSEKRIGTSFNISLPILEANIETIKDELPISA